MMCYSQEYYSCVTTENILLNIGVIKMNEEKKDDVEKKESEKKESEKNETNNSDNSGCCGSCS